jgi:hypothetical protein
MAVNILNFPFFLCFSENEFDDKSCCRSDKERAPPGEVAIMAVNILLFPFAVCISENDSGHKSQDGPDSGRGGHQGEVAQRAVVIIFYFLIAFFTLL